MRNILREGSRFGGQCWRTYNYVFCSQAAVDFSIDKYKLNPALALSYMQQLPSSTHSPRPLCFHCQEPDHSSTTCAFAPLASPFQHGPPIRRSQPSSPKPLPSKLPDWSQLCVSWNQGLCSASGRVCRYKHICSSCSENNWARDCSLTPDSEGSIFEQIPKQPPPTLLSL